MIRRRFGIFPGVGPRAERQIAQAGLGDWNAFTRDPAASGLPARLQANLQEAIGVWSNALEQGDPAFFARNLARKHHWMLYERFAGRICYLDIETTGLSPRSDVVTMVGLYDGRRFTCLVRDQDLTVENLAACLADCRMLVTYYGSSFDLSFLRRGFPRIDWDLPHFDLCFAGKRVGLTGGLKSIERQLGIVRDPSLVEVDGFEAVRLWHAHRRGDTAALPRLRAYNEADTVNLERIASTIYQRLCGL